MSVLKAYNPDTGLFERVSGFSNIYADPTTTGQIIYWNNEELRYELVPNILVTDGKITSTNDLTIDCGTEKTLLLNEPVWDDLRITLSNVERPGVSDPTLIAWQPGGSGASFYVYQFGKGQTVSFVVQLPHDYKQGTDIYCHVHWTPAGRGSAESGAVVAWALDYSWANIAGAFGASAPLDLSDTVTGTNHLHEMSPEAVISGTGKNISSMLICNFYRANIAGDTWVETTSGNLPIALEVDFHYQKDTMGSRQQRTK